MYQELLLGLMYFENGDVTDARIEMSRLRREEVTLSSDLSPVEAQRLGLDLRGGASLPE